MKTAFPPGVCEECGAEFERKPGPGRPRRYCDECSTPAASARRWRKANPVAVQREKVRKRGLYRPADRHPARCGGCGGPFMALDGQRFCKRSCRPPTGEKVAAVCEGCGKTFEARARDRAKGWARFCGKSCSTRARRAVQREAAAA